MKAFRKTTPVLDRNFGSNDTYLAELALRAYEVGAGHVQKDAIARWLN